MHRDINVEGNGATGTVGPMMAFAILRTFGVV